MSIQDYWVRMRNVDPGLLGPEAGSPGCEIYTRYGVAVGVVASGQALAGGHRRGRGIACLMGKVYNLCRGYNLFE